MASLDGQVILVTGATDGLGRALAADLVGAGATVLVHGRDPGRIAATVEELNAGDRVRSYQADLAGLAQVRALAEQVIAGERRLDVLKQEMAEREIRMLGEDPHQYGLTPTNRANLAALLDFFYRLGALERVLEPEELFV